MGDFNGDTRPDIYLANFSSNNVSVLLGNGTGGFGAQTAFAVGTIPVEVAVGDVNGDARPDMAMANVNSNNVSVLLGNGTGGFGAKTAFAVGTSPVLGSGERCERGHQTRHAMANYGSNNVSVLLGNGTGGFGAKTAFAVGTNPVPVVVGDVNGDTRPDLAWPMLIATTSRCCWAMGRGALGRKPTLPLVFIPTRWWWATLTGTPSPTCVANLSATTFRCCWAMGRGALGRKPTLRWALILIGSGGRLERGCQARPGRGQLGSNNVSVLLGNGAGGFGAKTTFALVMAPRR